jgi:hypothetical protein|uniref:Uncharacterized protein n=1 Tax=Sipha flava TaxID=143950 RepID=A0A2S2QBY1_9HEMI
MYVYTNRRSAQYYNNILERYPIEIYWRVGEVWLYTKRYDQASVLCPWRYVIIKTNRGLFVYYAHKMRNKNNSRRRVVKNARARRTRSVVVSLAAENNRPVLNNEQSFRIRTVREPSNQKSLPGAYFGPTK